MTNPVHDINTTLANYLGASPLSRHVMEAEEEADAVEQEREEAAAPDVESKDEEESEGLEVETEEESEEHESEKIEEREDDRLAAGKKKGPRKLKNARP
jgi:hypothetical protein